MWAAFTTAGFTFWAPAPITVRPAPPGATSGPFPFDRPAAFVTADNPGGRVLDESENLSRRSGLADALEELGLAWLPATGGDPDGAHLEPGAVVPGLDVASAIALGARFQQAAVYLWSSTALHLVACTGGRHDVLGYTATARSAAMVPPSLRHPVR